jgi:hypothetical protein
MNTKITPEALIEMGFRKTFTPNRFILERPYIDIHIDKYVKIGNRFTNATTIEDIKDLIRLFK